VNSKLPPGTRYRPRLSTGRRRRLFLRLSDDEYDDVIAAASRFGLTPTGFCSQAAVDTARNLDRGAEPMQQQTLAALQAELFQARVTLNQLRTALSHTRDDRRASPDDLDKIIARASDTAADLDTAATRIHQRLKPSRSTVSGTPPKPRSVDQALACLGNGLFDLAGLRAWFSAGSRSSVLGLRVESAVGVVLHRGARGGVPVR
jgi:hypothetical protein